MAYSSVADLTVDELRDLIKEVVTQTILEIFGDPDEGLELREEIKDIHLVKHRREVYKTR
jgi:hypothetical protein